MSEFFESTRLAISRCLLPETHHDLSLPLSQKADSSNILEEVATAVKNTVKNIIPGFLGTSSKPGPKIEPPSDFSDCLEFWDQYRIGYSVVVSPNRELAAVCDNFGRVTLIRVVDRIAIRMWKGYREAQCGWIEAQENCVDIFSKKVLFLCIYAPKRGLLEIWRCQHGARVEAFRVGRNCRLIYCPYSMLGMNDILLNQLRKNSASLLTPSNRCYLFDQDTCSLSEIKVPFVCALTEKFSLQKKDGLLLKEFKSLAPKEGCEDEVLVAQVISLFNRIKSHQTKIEAIDYTVHLPNPSLVKSLCSKLSKELPLSVSLKTDPNVLTLTLKCRRTDHLCKLYDDFSFLNTAAKKVKLFNSIHQNPPDFDPQALLLNWSVNDYVRCVSLFSFKESIFPNLSGEWAASSLTLENFVSFFSLTKYPTTDIDTDLNNALIFLEKHEDSNYFRITDLSKLGDFFLVPTLDDETLEECETTLSACKVAPSDILCAIFASWLNNEISSDWTNWPKFYQIVVKLVTKMKKTQSTEQEFWRSILKTLSHMIGQSTFITSALVASLVLRTAYSDLADPDKAIELKSKESSSEAQADSDVNMDECPEEEWESLSEEKEKLSLLVKQLQDCLFLSVTLRCNSIFDPGPISLIYLLESHPGIISELIAKWIISYPLEPLIILSLNDYEPEDEVKDPAELTFGLDIAGITENNFLGHDVFKQLLRKVRDHFPNSMECDIVLANCVWETVASWSKDPTGKISYLSLAMKYLLPISSNVLKHSIGCLVWKTFLLKRFETLALLMEKMAKVPKDRILQKDVGIDEKSLSLFITFIVDLFDLIIESSARADSEGMPLFRMDEWWKHRICSNSQLPLVFIAIQQKPGSPELLIQIYSLASIISLMIHLQIKNFKPLSMFPVDVRSMLFGELFLSLKNDSVDSILSQERGKFLLAAVTSVAQAIPLKFDSKPSYDFFKCITHSHFFSQFQMTNQKRILKQIVG